MALSLRKKIHMIHKIDSKPKAAKTQSSNLKLVDYLQLNKTKQNKRKGKKKKKKPSGVVGKGNTREINTGL